MGCECSLGRLKGDPSKAKQRRAKMHNVAQQLCSKIPGRIVIDLQREIEREHKLRSYSLEAVAKVKRGEPSLAFLISQAHLPASISSTEMKPSSTTRTSRP